MIEKKIEQGSHTNCQNITSVAHPLFAECVHGEGPPAQLVQATISFGPTESLFLSP